MQAYRLIASPGFLKRDFGDDCVVYLSGARETHLLSAAAAQVLTLMEEGAQSTSALVRFMQPHFEDADEIEVVALVDEVVDSLSRIGVIEAFEDAS